MPTLYDIAKRYKQTTNGKVNSKSPSIVSGLKVAKSALTPGYRVLTPEELLSLTVPTVTQNGSIDGYQRDATIRHARRIGQAIQRGEEIPPLSISIVGNAAELTDGQHRALGAVIARKSVPAIIKHRTANEAKKLFANQRRAKPVSPDTIVLAQHGLFAEYVQEAVTDPSHPWSSIVGFSRSASKIGPAQMLALVQVYVGGTIHNLHGGRETLSDDRFDRSAADRLAELLLCFGSRKDNPLAWKPVGLRASVIAATKILRRTGEKPADVERWHRHMPMFSFARMATVTTSPELAKQMIHHWNKRLSESRQVEL